MAKKDRLLDKDGTIAISLAGTQGSALTQKEAYRMGLHLRRAVFSLILS